MLNLLCCVLYSQFINWIKSLALMSAAFHRRTRLSELKPRRKKLKVDIDKNKTLMVEVVGDTERESD